jgi:dipeptidyl aminopeptidase/acylaminoacyl peptidase
MSRRRALQLVALAALASFLGGCGDAQPRRPAPHRDPFAYDRSRPLRPSFRTLARHGGLKVQRVTYTTVDGARVPALLASPRRDPVKGCLIYQGGAGSTKEQAAPLWAPLAAAGLATFTIDTRYTGARARSPAVLAAVLKDPERIATMIRGDVLDLRRALDLLDARPDCQHNIGYVGTSQGGLLGALLAADDQRIRAAVLMSIGATWRSALFYGRDVLDPGVTDRPQGLRRALRALTPYEAARWIGKIAPRPVMLVDGLRDPRVPVVEALNLKAAAGEPARLLLHRGGHDPFAPPDGSGNADAITLFLYNELVDDGTS